MKPRSFWLAVSILCLLPSPDSLLQAGPARKVSKPRFHASLGPVPVDMEQRMIGTTFKAGCPVPISDLVLVQVDHWGFDGEVKKGKVIVNEAVAEDVIEAFHAAFSSGFPIDKMEPAFNYGGDDEKSMSDNNTSSFNCRLVTGGKRFSTHAYGLAIDINPVQNPYVRGKDVKPSRAGRFVDRTLVKPGMITTDTAIYRAFVSRGWVWGGSWKSLKDYQHFEFPLRKLKLIREYKLDRSSR